MRRLTRWIGRLLAAYVAVCVLLALGSAVLTPGCAEVDETYDIAVVLGGGSVMGPRVMRERKGRVHAAIDLFDRHAVSRLHLTGGPAMANASNAPRMAGVARAHGIPEAAMTLEPDSLSTLQNALFSKPDLPQEARVIIVTDGYHAWRAQASFAWAGRPGAACAAPSPELPLAKTIQTMLREPAAWGLNLVRAATWSLGEQLGFKGRIPLGLLAQAFPSPAHVNDDDYEFASWRQM
ncbi:YdcF family protein [Mameliella sediminis]|uniref:YdcF family protein n=1 Tax=Mameliella sediminis TaxID=2836866 RepID=UPI001C45CB42|nr:YdcF family protein [Mameliella sediminis]MBV7392797.1 YdcF family protein [Mameliella sediminis]